MQKMCGCCDLLCLFSLLTCCGCRDVITRKLIFFPPACSYEIVEVASSENEDEEKEDGDDDDSGAKARRKRESASAQPIERVSSGLAHTQLKFEMTKEVEEMYDFPTDLWNDFQCDPSDFETVILTTRKRQRIPAYFIKYPKATFTILFSHGNAADIGMMRPHLLDLRRALKVNVFAYEYTGYGSSTGKASECNTYADCEAAYKYLVEDRRIAPHCVVGYGQSLGTAVTVHLAVHFEVGGVVLHSPLMSCLRVLEPVDKTYWFDAYPVIEEIQNVFVPVWIIHGADDKQISPIHGKILSKLVPNMPLEPWFVKGADHNNIEIYARDELFERILLFLDKIRDTPQFASHRTVATAATALSPKSGGRVVLEEKTSVSSVLMSAARLEKVDEVATDTLLAVKSSTPLTESDSVEIAVGPSQKLDATRRQFVTADEEYLDNEPLLAP